MSDNHNDIKPAEEAAPAEAKKRVRQHLIRPKGLRIAVKTIFWIIVAVLLIPVLLYVPPIQTAVKDLACDIVKDKTGMDISIDRFRLKFPLDVSLQGVSVTEASGDTMVQAGEAIADIRLLPLLKLDVRVNKLQLKNGFYRFVSPDSSMIMKIRARFLEVDDRSSVNISKSDILLNKAVLEGGDISLFMDVWKQKPTPLDTTSTPFFIKINDIKAKDMRFAMSMLPTIDTLVVNAKDLKLRDGIINLRTNDITARLLTLDGGDFKYLTPTPEWVAAHPAPVDTVTPPSPPMTIKADSISVDNLRGVYAIAGAKPLPGFDASYIAVSDVGLSMKNFYNQAVNLRLPLTRITAKERCGLFVTEGSGLISLSEEGIFIEGARLRTPYSDISATADVPFALMELKPEAPVNVQANASVGLPDVEAFMPDLRPILSKLPGRNPLTAVIDAKGTLSNVAVNRFDAAMNGIFSLRADGFARNALDFKNLVAQLDLDGEVMSPQTIEGMTGNLGVKLPPFRISGSAGANRQNYNLDMQLHTPSGGILATGDVSLNPERYHADIDVDNLNVADFMPDLGIGFVRGNLRATGAGFNPLKPGASTDVSLCIDEIIYNRNRLRDISLQAILKDDYYHLEIDSPNEVANLEAVLSGTIADDDYTVEGDLNLYALKMYELGFSDEENTDIKANMYVDARLQPAKWLYDADLKIYNLCYTSPQSTINIPAGIVASVQALEHSVMLNIDGDRTAMQFHSDEGLQKVVEGFTAAAGIATAQIDRRNLRIDSLQHVLPPFTLKGHAAGNGLLADFLAPSGINIDTLDFGIRNDSILRAGLSVRNIDTGSLTLDTINFGMKQRGSLIDYRAHMGNRPGTFDEFANVDLNGYVGSNRLSAFLKQKNIQGETGYRLGFTTAFADSTVNLHFTPLMATIAYMPWTFNADNFINVNLYNYHTEAKLKASSRESSLLLATELNDKGREILHLNLTDIHIEDFLQMSMLAPPIKANINSDLKIGYSEKGIGGRGTLSINDFYYEKTRVGDFDFNLFAGSNLSNRVGAYIAMKINGREAAKVSARLQEDDNGVITPQDAKLELLQFPLEVANPFLGADMMQLHGALNGEMKLSGTLASPMLNGEIATDSVRVFVPMIGSALKLNDDSITVADNILNLNDFNIYGANKNPLTLSGSVNAQNLSDIYLDLSANAREFQLIGNNEKARSDIYGKVFLNLGATVKGPMKHFDVNGTLGILGNTDVYYMIPGGASSLEPSSSEGVVTFVNFNDTTAKAEDKSQQAMAMRVKANLTITPGARVCVFLSSNKTYKVTAQPSGSLSYYQNFMGDMSLNGQILLGEGLIRYGFPVLGDKTFEINPQSSVNFAGNLMNPGFNINLTDKIRGNVVNSSGNSQVVNFIVGLAVTGNLNAPKIQFDLSTEDDLTLQNELTAMTPEQRSMQAMNLIITGRYQGNGLKSANGNFMTGTLYSFLTSQINSWAAQNIKGVDLSFGVDQYDKSTDGQKSTAMSYSYQVSKSLFNNKFKIVVGGNYNTDSSEDNIADNLLSDVSFEYMLKQTNSLTMLVKLFRHSGYESILEGEITETGVGFEMRRRLNTLRNLFKVRWGKRKPQSADRQTPDGKPGQAVLPSDTATAVRNNGNTTATSRASGDNSRE